MSLPARRTRLGVALFAGGMLAWGTGCEAPGGERHWAVRDSAGIRIVENELPGGPGPGRRSLSDRPVVDIVQDESDPERLWTYIRRVFWWRDGRIGVAVSDPPFLRIFSARGEPLGAVGQEGEGPGEVRAVTWAGALGDSAVLRSPSALSVYDPEGEFVRRVPFGGELTGIVASTPAGWIVKSRQPYADDHAEPPPPPQVTADWTVTRVARSGAVTDTLAGFEQVLTWRVQGALWGELEHVASDGRRVYEMDSRRYEVRVHEDGAVTRIIRAPIPTLPRFTEAHLEALREQWGELAQRFIDSDREAGRMIVPPAVAMRVDEERDELWIRRTDDGPRAPVRRWDVFSAEGVWAATVETPPQLGIRAVRGDRVLGIWTDELGVTSVRVYALELGG